MKKYGSPVLLLAACLALHACQQPEGGSEDPAGMIGPGRNSEAEGGLAGNTEAVALATTSIPAWKTVKDVAIYHNVAFERWYTVPVNGTISASARASGSTDPMILAFYRTSGTSGSKEFTTTFVAFNDNRGDGSRNPAITWRNETGSSQLLTIVVFAKNLKTTGPANIYVTDPSGQSLRWLNFSLYARPTYSHTQPGPFAGCTESSPQRTRIAISRAQSSVSDSDAVLAFNASTMRGGFVSFGGTNFNSIELQEHLPQGNGNFLLAYARNRPPVVNFHGLQQDLYDCAESGP